MIRQPRRSTAAPAASRRIAADTVAVATLNIAIKPQPRNISTRLSRKNYYLKFAIFLLIVTACLAWRTCEALPATYEQDADAMTVGSSAHEPKFGERLMPLRKKISVYAKYGANSANTTTITITTNKNLTATKITTTTPTTTTTTTKKSVNNLNLNKNNYIVSNSQQQQQQLKNSENRHNLNETFYDLVTVVPLEDFVAAKPRRQGKQLHRRQDDNIAEVLELPEQPQEQPQDQQPQQVAEFAATSNASSLKADRLVEMSTEFFIVPTYSTTTTSRATLTTTKNPQKSRNSIKTSRGVSTHGMSGGPRSVLIVAPKSSTPNTSTSSGAIPTIISTQFNSGGLRKEPWVVPVLVLAALTMLMMVAFEIFVLFKAWRTSPSRRHLFLGQMLLLGLFACAGLGAIITAQPSVLSCGTLRFGVGVAYALVFAALLVKCVFLISLNGGVYLPAPYQGLLLLFAVLIQVAIGAQWLLTTPPEIYTLSVPYVSNSGVFATASSSNAAAEAFAHVFNSVPASPTPAELFTHASHVAGVIAINNGGNMLIPLCKTQFSELLFSLIYIIFLIVFVSVLAIKSRGIRDNYREATYIGLAIGGAIPIWLGWMLCGLAVAERHKDACIAFGLVATSATVFLVMFMPKGRQLAAMGKEGLYVEDREEQFSSLSRAGSGYSPSFFHFKPIKYGVMGGMQNSTSNTGNATSMKHCSNGMNGGDRVALVTAAPPSYTRMYHYFPAHLTHPFCFYPQPPPPPIPQMTQLSPPPPPTLKHLGNSITSMTQAHIAQTLRYPGLFIRPDETNLYTTLEPTLSSNPNVYFQRGSGVHPGMMY